MLIRCHQPWTRSLNVYTIAQIFGLQGKLDTEKLLTDRGVNFTSVRPVYIYGPLNYNPVEEWFFHRIKAGRPIPVPNSGKQASRYLGQVTALNATATVLFVACYYSLQKVALQTTHTPTVS